MAEKIHIHIYKITAKAEVDFEPKDGVTLEQREGEALEMANDGKLQFKESDCELIALGFEDG